MMGAHVIIAVTRCPLKRAVPRDSSVTRRRLRRIAVGAVSLNAAYIGSSGWARYFSECL